MNKVLEIKHCNKSFGENEVLKDISLSVTEGQVVSIIGPSGSGKSTLLRCATMLETMDGGDLIYLGDYAAKADAQGKAVYAAKETLQGIKKHFGLVFQNFNLFPPLFRHEKYHRTADSDRQAQKRGNLCRGKGAAEKNGTGGQGKRLPL